MPRGFLVKRHTKHHHPVSYRVALLSDDDRSEDRSDSGSDHGDSRGKVAWSPELSRPTKVEWDTQEDGRRHVEWSPELARPSKAMWMPDLCRPDKPVWSPELSHSVSTPIRVPMYRSSESVAVSDRDSPFSAESRSPMSTASSSPLPLSIHPYFTAGSPLLYINGFDKLSVHSPGNTPNRAPTPGSVGSSSPSMSSPSKRRLIGETKTRIQKKSRAARKLNFDEETSSPVSGTIIKKLDKAQDGIMLEKCADIDSSLNVVVITPEAKAELAKIENKIGDYVCQLCKEKYDDAFHLAQHRCSRIVYIEYRCPECEKVFNCPANLASHRRWHKPKPEPQANNDDGKSTNSPVTANEANSFPNNREQSEQNNKSQTANLSAGRNSDGEFSCDTCGKKFKRQAYLRKHVLAHSDSSRQQQCQHCGQLFSNTGDKLRHIMDFHPGTTVVHNHRCIVCGCGFGTRVELDKHARAHVSEAFPCKYCDGTFFTSPGLTRHINKCHPTESRQVILLQMPTI